MGIHRKKEDFLKKKKMYCITFSVTHNGVSVIISRVIITVKDKPWISLVKLVVSLIFRYFEQKRKQLLRSLLSEGSHFRRFFSPFSKQNARSHAHPLDMIRLNDRNSIVSLTEHA